MTNYDVFDYETWGGRDDDKVARRLVKAYADFARRHYDAPEDNGRLAALTMPNGDQGEGEDAVRNEVNCRSFANLVQEVDPDALVWWQYGGIVVVFTALDEDGCATEAAGAIFDACRAIYWDGALDETAVYNAINEAAVEEVKSALRQLENRLFSEHDVEVDFDTLTDGELGDVMTALGEREVYPETILSPWNSSPRLDLGAVLLEVLEELEHLPINAPWRLRETVAELAALDDEALDLVARWAKKFQVSAYDAVVPCVWDRGGRVVQWCCAPIDDAGRIVSLDLSRRAYTADEAARLRFETR